MSYKKTCIFFIIACKATSYPHMFGSVCEWIFISSRHFLKVFKRRKYYSMYFILNKLKTTLHTLTCPTVFSSESRRAIAVVRSWRVDTGSSVTTRLETALIEVCECKEDISVWIPTSLGICWLLTKCWTTILLVCGKILKAERVRNFKKKKNTRKNDHLKIRTDGTVHACPTVSTHTIVRSVWVHTRPVVLTGAK